MDHSSPVAGSSRFWLTAAALVLLASDNLLVAWFNTHGMPVYTGSFAEVSQRHYERALLFDGWRFLVPVAILVPLIMAGKLRRADLGLALGRHRLTLYWVLMPACLAGLVAAALALVLAAVGWKAFLYPTEIWLPSLAGYYFLHGCVLCPLYEELIYRGVLVPAVERTTGSALMGVVCSALAFTVIHLVAGRPWWTMAVYLFGGALMAWAFVKSRSLLAPILLHFLGNLVVLAKDLIALNLGYGM